MTNYLFQFAQMEHFPRCETFWAKTQNQDGPGQTRMVGRPTTELLQIASAQQSALQEVIPNTWKSEIHSIS